jgi:hypothetical protein
MIRSLLGLGVAGFGLGAGARAMTGVNHLLRANARTPVAASASVPQVINVPTPSKYPTMPEEEEEAPLMKLAQALARDKAAYGPAGPPSPSPSPAPDLGSRLAGMVPQGALDAIPSISNSGHPLASWQGLPAALGAGAVGIGGGWALLDTILKKRRKAELGEEVEDARGDYRQALGDEYNAAMKAKQASDESPLDRAFEAWERTKEAEGSIAPQPIVDGANALGGAYLATLLGVGGASAYGTYKWTRNRSDQAMLRKAIQARARARQAPQPLYAVPTDDLSTV